MDSSDQTSLVPPVLTLPPEIVSEIFINFLPSYPNLPPQLGLFSPLLLCRICRLWRAIAVSVPDLWRAMPLDLSYRDVPSSQEFAAAQVGLVETWLARSGTRPLSIRLVSASWVNPDLTVRLLHKLLPHCERWEYLTLVVPMETLALVDGSMPLLRALTLGPNRYTGLLPNVLTLFHRAPELRSVVLTESFLISAISLPWAQLTRLESQCLYPYECTWILEAAPQLVYCEFTVFDEDGQLPTPVVHTGLRHLILDDGDSHDEEVETTDLADLLDKLTLPALKTLEVSEPCVTMEALNVFILRSSCALEELVINWSSLSKGTYSEVFPSIPNIVVHSEHRFT
ncbi:hypothetical protein C8R46DRAFT_1081926 [Mycena filopes]|nr:hypothetical protein C8R46DRAFT_1081926 [Mycena filopes]